MKSLIVDYIATHNSWREDTLEYGLVDFKITNWYNVGQISSISLFEKLCIIKIRRDFLYDWK